MGTAGQERRSRKARRTRTRLQENERDDQDDEADSGPDDVRVLEEGGHSWSGEGVGRAKNQIPLGGELGPCAGERADHGRAGATRLARILLSFFSTSVLQRVKSQPERQ